MLILDYPVEHYGRLIMNKKVVKQNTCVSKILTIFLFQPRNNGRNYVKYVNGNEYGLIINFAEQIVLAPKGKYHSIPKA